MDVVRRKHLTQRALTDLEEVVLDVLFEHDPTFLQPKQIGELIGIASALTTTIEIPGYSHETCVSPIYVKSHCVSPTEELTSTRMKGVI